MDQKEKKQENEIEIDLGKVLRAILGRAWLIMLVAVLCASAMFTATKYMVTPLYKSSAKFYVNNSALSVGNTSLSISSSDLVTSRGLVDSYIVILNTKETLEEVISSVGSDLTYKQLSGMISAGAVNETEIFAVTVTSADPEVRRSWPMRLPMSSPSGSVSSSKAPPQRSWRRLWWPPDPAPPATVKMLCWASWPVLRCLPA